MFVRLFFYFLLGFVSLTTVRSDADVYGTCFNRTKTDKCETMIEFTTCESENTKSLCPKTCKACAGIAFRCADQLDNCHELVGIKGCENEFIQYGCSEPCRRCSVVTGSLPPGTTPQGPTSPTVTGNDTVENGLPPGTTPKGSTSPTVTGNDTVENGLPPGTTPKGSTSPTVTGNDTVENGLPPGTTPKGSDADVYGTCFNRTKTDKCEEMIKFTTCETEDTKSLCPKTCKACAGIAFRCADQLNNCHEVVGIKGCENEFIQYACSEPCRRCSVVTGSLPPGTTPQGPTSPTVTGNDTVENGLPPGTTPKAESKTKKQRPAILITCRKQGRCKIKKVKQICKRACKHCIGSKRSWKKQRPQMMVTCRQKGRCKITTAKQFCKSSCKHCTVSRGG